jgi:hypothetical protein
MHLPPQPDAKLLSNNGGTQTPGLQGLSPSPLLKGLDTLSNMIGNQNVTQKTVSNNMYATQSMTPKSLNGS